MANNRLYLRCKGCGETFFLGKRMLDTYYNTDNYYSDKGVPMHRRINDFFSKHKYCDGYGLDCYELEYEMDPNYDCGGKT